VDARIAVEVRGEGGVVSFVVRRDNQDPAVRTFDRLPVVCADRRKAVALAIALAIDSTLLDSLGEPPAPPASGPQPATPPAPSPPPARAAADSRRLHIRGTLIGGALFKVLPKSAYSVYAGAELGWGDVFDLRLGALGTSTTQSDIRSGTADAALWAARIDGCVPLASGVVWPRACAGTAAGAVHASGRGFQTSLNPNVPWASAIVRLDARVRLGAAMALEAGVDGSLAVLRPELAVLSPQSAVVESDRLPLLGAAATVGAVFFFR
jgi:hypothetical protein